MTSQSERFEACIAKLLVIVATENTMLTLNLFDKHLGLRVRGPDKVLACSARTEACLPSHCRNRPGPGLCTDRVQV